MFKRRRSTQDFDDEIKAHLALEADELRREGLTEEEAYRRARASFGNAQAARERFYLKGRMEWLDNRIQDLRFALRQLRKDLGFALTAVLILALGLSSSVAIFAFVDAALVKPLPYQEPNRLVMLFESIPLGPRFHLSYPDYLDWKRQNTVFRSLDVFEPFGFMMKTSDGLRQTDGARVSSGFFRTLGVKPVLGRDFYDGEDKPETPRTTLLSYAAWQRRYGSDPKIIGQPVVLDGDTYTIVGVLPREFSFSPAEPADFWSILKATSTCRGCHGLYGVARLKDGVTFGAAFANIKAVAENLEKMYPDSNRDQKAYMLPLAEVITGDIRPVLVVMLSGAGLLLLIAAINVASLLLVRAESRRREVAVRGALGASQRRLALQFITEGVLLTTIGSVLGLAMAQQGMHMLTLLIPKDMLAAMPFLRGLGLNGHVLLFAGALAIAAAALFALTPMALFRVMDIREGLTEGSRSSSSTLWRRFGANMVVVELATAMVLLVGAGLLGKSFYKLLHTDTGLQSDHIATVHIQAESEKYNKDELRAALAHEVERRVQALPGVQAVGITTKLPIEDADWTSSFTIPGRPDNDVHKEVAVRYVTSGYMNTLKTRLISGRYFAAEEPAKVVIVNQTLAKQYFPGEDVIGKRIAFDSKNPLLIIGAINDIQEGQLDAKPRGAAYMPFYQSPYFNGFVVLARTSQDESSMLSSLTATLHDLDKGMALYNPMTMEQKIHDAPSTYLHRSSAWLVAGFALMALALGVVGLYGVIAYSVSRRTREIGVRMALGAQRRAVYGLVLRQAGWLTLCGLVIGLVCSIGAAVSLQKLLYGVQAWDAITLAGVAVLLGAVSMVASCLPAHRAASLNPTDALRTE
ncbi:ABC transporter permease [Terriglobus albidus]|uniref:ABC transporter permease n=1 Tax=Terriglobus albidus TaxID=1592106 RepID=UPI0021DFCEA8|nr:ABC transporter permease [Terriglobus albidus]